MTHVTTPESSIPLQAASLDIWDKKYRLRDKFNKPVDKTIGDTFERVAKALASVEIKAKQKHWHQQFLWALENGAIPAGRILSNAGATSHKPSTSTVNCTVSGTIDDSMSGILDKLKESGLTLKAGCGIGYEFSALRPKGALVSGSGASTSGPLSFMDIFDKTCATISSAGGRRGAQMGTFDIGHPDVLDFIKAKREDGRLRQFNLSLLISDDFIRALKAGENWPLSFPVSLKEQDGEIAQKTLLASNSDKVLWRPIAYPNNYLQNDDGLTACNIYKELPAEELWDVVMRSTYNFSEPGFILIDRVNDMNNNWFCEDIRATNPCGEQPLPPYGSCLLGSINLVGFVKNPFADNVSFDWKKFREVVAVFTRMLDNVVQIHGLPLAQQAQEIMRKRRHGMGFLGLGSALSLLKIPYGSPASIAFTEQVSRELALTGWQVGLELAEEKGPAPIFNEEFTITPELLRKRPQLANDGIRAGDRLPGKVLHSRYSYYMQKIAEEDQQLVSAIIEKGCRFTHHTSIAPTGTIALSLANNASNGIEPSFAHQYNRNVVRAGRKTKENLVVYSLEYLTYRTLVDGEVSQERLPEYFVRSDQIDPKQHVDVQAAAQKWIDSSISKTINVPTDINYEHFKEIYLYAYDQGLKGCTTFRFNPEVFQGVLVRDQDLANTYYCFELEDGSSLEVAGNEMIEYDNEIHTAANLYDALKEGYYGKL